MKEFWMGFWKSFKEMTTFEKIWLGIFSAIIISTTIIFSIQYTDWSSPESILINWFFSPISALTGVACVILAARGSYWTFATGTINSLFYGIVAWKTGYYGDFLLNIFFFLPTQYLIWKYWKKNTLDDKTDIVKMKKLSVFQNILLAISAVVFILGLGYVLNNFDHFAATVMKRNVSIYNNITSFTGFSFVGPVLDASTEFTQIVAEILMIMRFAEQWIFWFVTDIITIVMWVAVIVTDPTSFAYSVPTLAMWIAYLINSFYGAFVWFRSRK